LTKVTGIDRRGAKAISVLHVFFYFQPDFTGEGLYFQKLAPLLARLGIRSDVAVAAKRPADSRDFPGIERIHRFVDANTEVRPWGNRPLLLWFLLNAWRYDVVHFHCFVDRLFLLHLIARCFGCRVVQSATLDDGLGMVVDGYRPYRRRFVRRLCRLVHHAVAISPRLFEDSLRVLPRSRTSLIPQGVDCRALAPDPARRASARAAFGFTPSDFVLLFIGGICARKDVGMLIDAMPAVRRTHAAARLMIVGPDLEKDYAESLRRRAASLGEGGVWFTGFLEDPVAAYAAADVFVFASRDEGFGNVLIEAMAAGLPVVARHLPGVTDSFIVDNKNGFLFSNVSDYCAVLDRLIGDARLCGDIGRVARMTAAEHDIDIVAGRYADIYREVVEDACAASVNRHFAGACGERMTGRGPDRQ
jgi:glycosyltransferase involved in cell wall biosynthesis